MFRFVKVSWLLFSLESLGPLGSLRFSLHVCSLQVFQVVRVLRVVVFYVFVRLCGPVALHVRLLVKKTPAVAKLTQIQIVVVAAGASRAFHHPNAIAPIERSLHVQPVPIVALDQAVYPL